MHYVMIFLLFGSTDIFSRESPVSADVVRLESVTSLSKVTSRVVAREILVVAADTDERVSRVSVAVGDRVRAGTELATLEKDNIALRIDTLETEIAYLDILIGLLSKQEALRNRQFERANQLNARDLLTRDATELAELNSIQTQTNLAEARHDLAYAKLALANANQRMSATSIAAKTTGRIINVAISAGQYVERGDDLFEILPDNVLELDAELRADVFEALTVGQIVTASFKEQSFDVKVRALLAEENQRTGVRHVRLKFTQSPGGGLLLGQVAELMLPIGKSIEALTVYKDAIMPTPQGPRVVLVVDGKAVPISVTLGRGVKDRIVVEQGVSVGDIVVVQGQEGLRKGQLVRIVKGK